MQLAAGVVGVVHAADAGAELEAQRRVVAQQPGDGRQVLAADVEGDLAAVDDDLLDARSSPAPQPVASSASATSSNQPP